MGDYMGVIVEQSLRGSAITKDLNVVSVKRGTSWVFWLVAVPVREFEQHVKLIQSGMVDDDRWYAHYFRGTELVVVYRDAAFHVSTDPATFTPAVEHGLALGIPREQLDFEPRTPDAARAFFEIR